VEHDQLKHELEAMIVTVANTYKITCLKAQLLKITIRGTKLKRTGSPEGST